MLWPTLRPFSVLPPWLSALVVSASASAMRRSDSRWTLYLRHPRSHNTHTKGVDIVNAGRGSDGSMRLWLRGCTHCVSVTAALFRIRRSNSLQWLSNCLRTSASSSTNR